MAIERFRDEHYFLSSMYPVKGGIEVGKDLVVPTVENGYQAAKFEDMQIRKAILGAPDGFVAKKTADRYQELGVPVREDWEEIKVELMRDLVGRKFAQHPRLAQGLLETADEEIVEGNTWDDNFWGVSPPGNPEGQNWLGRILMETRQRLRDEKK